LSRPRLLSDIGATNVRFALLSRDGSVDRTENFRSLDYETLDDAIDAYLQPLPSNERPKEAAFAIAAAVTGDKIAMLNAPWTFSIQAVKQHYGWSTLHVINDFAANALAVPLLPQANVVQVGEGTPAQGEPIAVLGPGTGLGVAGLIRCANKWTAIAGEGGHATLAPMDSREAAIIDILRRQYAHVSAERVLSGPGLVNLYDALCELAGKPAAPLTPERVTDLYPGCDPQARETVMMFCGMLGTFAGSLALTFGARAGVYIMGGIVPKMLGTFIQSNFRERFEFHGRYRAYLGEIPTYVVTHANPAFLGLSTLFSGTAA
jgi:glucokinase